MDNKLKGRIMRILPFAVVIAIIFLVAPAFLVAARTDRYNSLVYLGLFPITAFVCSFIYGYQNGMYFPFSLIAPVVYIPSMFLYGNYKDNFLNCIIFLVSYFLCSYIGLLVGELGNGGKKGDSKKSKDAVSDRRASDNSKRGGKSAGGSRGNAPKRESERRRRPQVNSEAKDTEISDEFFSQYQESKQNDREEYDFEKSADDEIDKILREIRGDE